MDYGSFKQCPTRTLSSTRHEPDHAVTYEKSNKSTVSGLSRPIWWVVSCSNHLVMLHVEHQGIGNGFDRLRSGLARFKFASLLVEDAKGTALRSVPSLFTVLLVPFLLSAKQQACPFPLMLLPTLYARLPGDASTRCPLSVLAVCQVTFERRLCRARAADEWHEGGSAVQSPAFGALPPVLHLCAAG